MAWNRNTNEPDMQNTNELTVDKLIRGMLGTEYDDKVFWYAASIQKSENILSIEIENNSGLTAFRPFCEQIKVSCLDELAQIKPIVNWAAGFGPVLVSSGSFLFINGKLAVTRRSADAKVDPNLWTTPAGRCDRTPLETALKETIEEIKIYDTEGNILIPEAAVFLLTEGQKFKTYPTKEKDDKYPIKTMEVQCILDGKIIETCYMWAYYSPQANTLELRLPLFTELREQLILKNEEYGTETILANLADLKHDKVVPAVKELLRDR